MTSFERGFINQAIANGVNPAKAARLFKSAEGILDSIYPATGHSIFDVAENVSPSGNGSWDTVKEVGALGAHMGTHGIAPGAIGALGGAGIGALMGGKNKNDKDDPEGRKHGRGSAAAKGALIGGALGFGSGAVHDAYHLGDNTKDDIRHSLVRELKRIQENRESNAQSWNPFKPSDSHYDKASAPYLNQLKNIKDTSWYDYFMPWQAEQKLHK